MKRRKSAEKALSNLVYDNLSREKLIEHCKAYTITLHRLLPRLKIAETVIRNWLAKEKAIGARASLAEYNRGVAEFRAALTAWTKVSNGGRDRV